MANNISKEEHSPPVKFSRKYIMGRCSLKQVTQQAVTCPNLTIETLKQEAKYVQSQPERRYSTVSIVNFEQINVGWESCSINCIGTCSRSRAHIFLQRA